MDTFPLLCECNSVTCDRQVEVSLEEAQRIREIHHAVVIVDGCPRGPEPTDTFLEEKPGYRIYTES